MKLTITGPEQHVVEINNPGTYNLGRDVDVREIMVGRATTITGLGEPKIIAVGHTSISKEHLEMRVKNNKVILIDKKSNLGSFLNGEKFKKISLNQPGDYDLKLGAVEFKLNYIK